MQFGILMDALNGKGDPSGINIGGQPLASYDRNPKGVFGLWVQANSWDSSTEDDDDLTDADGDGCADKTKTLASLTVRMMFVPLASMTSADTKGNTIGQTRHSLH